MSEVKTTSYTRKTYVTKGSIWQGSDIYSLLWSKPEIDVVIEVTEVVTKEEKEVTVKEQQQIIKDLKSQYKVHFDKANKLHESMTNLRFDISELERIKDKYGSEFKLAAENSIVGLEFSLKERKREMEPILKFKNEVKEKYGLDLPFPNIFT